MLSMHMDAAGADQLAKQLEIALAVEGVNAPECAVRAAIASLLQIDSWATLQRKAEHQTIKLTYGNDPNDFIYRTLQTAVMTLATVMDPIHPSQLDVNLKNLKSGVEYPDQPLLITHTNEDPPLMRIHFNGVASGHNQGMYGEPSALSSRDPAKLGYMLASVLCREIYLADAPDFVDATIEHDPETGEDEVIDDQGENDSDWEACPHCRATRKFALYAQIHQLPAPDEQFPAMEIGEAGELTVFAPYDDKELMFCMVEDEESTWLPEGTILPMRWDTALFDVILNMERMPPIEVGQQVLNLFGMIQWPNGHFMNGISETGVVRLIQLDGNGETIAKIKVKGQRRLLTFPVSCLVPL